MKARTNLFFRTDGNSHIGMGHLVRCAALAEMLADVFDITFILKNTTDALLTKFVPQSYSFIHLKAGTLKEEPHELKKIMNSGELPILVLDGYQFDSDYQAHCKELNCKLVYLDDLMFFNYSCDVLINQADLVKEGQYHINKEARLCLGPNYVLLRPVFLRAAKKEIRKLDKVKNVFISFGGADPDRLTERILKIISKIRGFESIHVLTGPVNTEVISLQKQFSKLQNIHFHTNLSSGQVFDLINGCDLAICSASNLALEVCAIGCLLILGTSAENQNGYYKGLTQVGAAIGIGNWKACDEDLISKEIEGSLLLNSNEINEMLLKQRKYIDGFSDTRLKSVFLDLI